VSPVGLCTLRIVSHGIVSHDFAFLRGVVENSLCTLTTREECINFFAVLPFNRDKCTLLYEVLVYALLRHIIDNKVLRSIL
jgi:hypothetical protein